MSQCVLPLCGFDDVHARVPGPDCACIVACCAAGCAVGHDVQRHAVPHEDEPARDATVTQAREKRALEMMTVEEVRRCCRGQRCFFRPPLVASALALSLSLFGPSQ